MGRKSLTFFVGLAVTITLSCIHTTAQPTDVPPSGAAKQQVDDQPPKQNQNSTPHDGEPGVSNELFWNLSPNAWMAIFTVVLVGVASIQALIYGLQLRTVHRVERAYVYVNAITAFTGYETNSRPDLTFEVINSGRTPAHILSYGAAMWFREKGIAKPPMPLKDSDLLTLGFHMVTNQKRSWSWFRRTVYRPTRWPLRSSDARRRRSPSPRHSRVAANGRPLGRAGDLARDGSGVSPST